MNTILIQGDWHILKGKLKQTWALLTGDRLEYREGRSEVCLGRIQKKAGEKRAAIDRTLRECEKLRKKMSRP